MQTTDELKTQPTLFDFSKLDFALSQYPLNITLHAEGDDKTEKPTEARKRKARDDGDVYLTQELPQALVMVFPVLAILVFADFFFREIKDYLVKYLTNTSNYLITPENANVFLSEASLAFARLFLPVGVVSVVVVFFGVMLQTRFHFSTKKLKLDTKKILFTWKNFVQKTIFTRQQLVSTLKMIVKLLLTFGIVYVFMMIRSRAGLQILYGGFNESLVLMGRMIVEIFLIFGLVFFIISLIDWYLQKIEHERKLKMSKQEIKEEVKEQEGDPQIRQRQRERAKQMLNQKMFENVKEASFVVTNPTHYACAIYYELGETDVPKLVAKGADNVALKIKEIAKKNNIPIVENKPLARGLYDEVEIDDYVPATYYTAIIEIFKALDLLPSMTGGVGS